MPNENELDKFHELIVKLKDYAVPAAIQSALSEDGMTDEKIAIFLKNIDIMFNNLGVSVAAILPPLLVKSYFEGIDKANEFLAQQGISMPGKALINGKVTSEFKTKVHVEAVNEIVNDTMLDMAAAIRTAKETFNTTYKQTLENIKDDIAKGLIQGDNREKIIRDVKNSLISGGFTSFTTVDGKRLPLEFYARTVTRTKLRAASNHGHANRLVETDNDLFYVTGREPTCGECAKYRNQVFSISGNHPDYPQLDPYKTFPVHPNCQCMIRPWVEKYKTDEEKEAAKEAAKNFNPEKDPRTKVQRNEYAKDQEMKRIARQEDKQYLAMRAVLGNKAPKSIGAFRNIKRNNPEKYQELINMARNPKDAPKINNKAPKELNKRKSAKTIDRMTSDAIKNNEIK